MIPLLSQRPKNRSNYEETVCMKKQITGVHATALHLLGKIKTADSDARHQFPESLRRESGPRCHHAVLYMPSSAVASSRHRFDPWCPPVSHLWPSFWAVGLRIDHTMYHKPNCSELSIRALRTSPILPRKRPGFVLHAGCHILEWSMVVVPQIERHQLQQDRGGCHIPWVVLYGRQSSI